MEPSNLPMLPASAPDVHRRWLEVISDELCDGETPQKLAKRIYPDDESAQRKFKRRLHKFAVRDEEFQRLMYEKAQANLILGLGIAAEALSRRAGSGYTPAVKLIMEATGFHNPRVRHDHTGEVKVTIDIPRAPELAGEAGQVVDADVVEEGPESAG